MSKSSGLLLLGMTNTTFAKGKLAIGSGNWKLHLRTAKIIMETEMQNKHGERRKLKKEIVSISIQVNSMLGLFLHSAC